VEAFRVQFTVCDVSDVRAGVPIVGADGASGWTVELPEIVADPIPDDIFTVTDHDFDPGVLNDRERDVTVCHSTSFRKSYSHVDESVSPAIVVENAGPGAAFQ